MAQVILITHMPLMRMERRDDFPIGRGVLTKLPWEQFDQLSQGAFTDWRRKYEKADPVFFWYQDDLDLPFVKPGACSGREELKVPTAAWNTLVPRLGHGLVTLFHSDVVDPVWAALALAAPAGVLPAPRTSVTFFMPAGDAHFEIGNRTMHGARIQGDADMELAFLPDAAASPLNDEDLTRAEGLTGLAEYALGHAVTGPALRQLLTCGDVTLAPYERLLLAVTAIEHLLLPDISSGTGETFATRLASLLTRDEQDKRAVYDMARSVYRLRTAVLHSEGPRVEGQLPAGAAEQLLARALEAATLAIHSGSTVEQLRTNLDEGRETPGPPSGLPATDPRGRGTAYRLGPREPWESATFSSGESLASPEGTIVSWSPLVGLTHGAEPLRTDELGIMLTSIGSDAVVGMEEKDIRRDFIAKTRLGGPVAILATATDHQGLVVHESDVQPLTRRRDLAVVGLRLAGIETFVDPELLGWYVYAGSIRYRRETVFRQSIIMHIEAAEPAVVPSEKHEEVRGWWSLLARYDRTARTEELDRILDLFRRVHDRRFLPSTTRATLVATTVEAMLGRFRPATATLRLERLVNALDDVPTDAAQWFELHGRAFRNAVAHGEWSPELIEPSETFHRDHEPVAHLLSIARAGVRTLLKIWVDAPPPVRARYGPARLLVRTLGKRAS